MIPDECWEIGLGEPGYDCSGFIILAASRVLGRTIDAWPKDQRHVREWWSQESSLYEQHQLTEDMARQAQPGDILVGRREYETDAGLVVLAGHVSIVTKAATEESLPHIINANTNLTESIREVIERPMFRVDTILGSLTLKDDILK